MKQNLCLSAVEFIGQSSLIFKQVVCHALSKCLVEGSHSIRIQYSWRAFLQHPQSSCCNRTSRGDGGISRRRCSCCVGYFQLKQCGGVVLQCRSSRGMALVTELMGTDNADIDTVLQRGSFRKQHSISSQIFVGR